VSLGRATLRHLGLELGDTLEAVGPSGRPVPLRIVGETVGLGVFDDLVPLDEGAVITFGGVREMIDPASGVEPYATGYLVRLTDGPTRDATVAQLRETFPGAVFGPRSTPDIENLRRVQWLPRLLVAGVGIMAIGTTAHALFSAARRRRRDLAVLKSVGFSRGQLASVTSAQASTYAVVALALGVPLGIALGRLLWGAAADQIGTFASASMPLAVLALAAAATIVLANLLALWPGRVAARVPAAIVLRTE
jgi:predicted lysophospholipase L1 biosynthesis ABC-type transport system permease subunit